MAPVTPEIHAAYHRDNLRELSVEFHALAECRTPAGVREVQQALVTGAALVREGGLPDGRRDTSAATDTASNGLAMNLPGWDWWWPFNWRGKPNTAREILLTHRHSDTGILGAVEACVSLWSDAVASAVMTSPYPVSPAERACLTREFLLRGQAVRRLDIVDGAPGPDSSRGELRSRRLGAAGRMAIRARRGVAVCYPQRIVFGRSRVPLAPRAVASHSLGRTICAH